MLQLEKEQIQMAIVVWLLGNKFWSCVCTCWAGRGDETELSLHLIHTA